MKSARSRASSYSRRNCTNAVPIRTAVIPNRPRMSGRRDLGSPPMISWAATSGRSVAVANRLPMSVPIVSRAVNGEVYCAGERYSSTP